MGKQKYQQAIGELLAKSPVISFASLQRLVTGKKKVKGYGKQLVHNLVRQGKLKPLAKGWYTTHDEASLAVYCFQPAYLGLQDAVSYHGFWEQETIPIILTTRKVRRGIRNVLGSNVLIRHLDTKYYFGMAPSADRFAVPYSDTEKTLIDLVYFKQGISPAVQKEFKKKVDQKKLKKYLQPYPLSLRKKVLKMMRY